MTPNDITTEEIVYPICPPCKRGEHERCWDIMPGGLIACGCETCGPDDE